MTVESEAVQALEKQQSAEPIRWWETEPMRWWEDKQAITVESAAKSSTKVETAAAALRKPEALTSAAKPTKGNPLIVLVVIVAVIAAVTFLELMRR